VSGTAGRQRLGGTFRPAPPARVLPLVLAIILYKGLVLHRAHRQSTTFSNLSKEQQVLGSQLRLPAASREPAVRRLPGRLPRGEPAGPRTGPPVAGAAQRPTVRSLDALSRSLARAAGVEITRIERRLSFLATTASVCLSSASSARCGHHGSVPGHRPDGFGQPDGRGAGHLRGADHDRDGPPGRDPRGRLLQLLQQRVKVLSAMLDDFALEFLNIVEGTSRKRRMMQAAGSESSAGSAYRGLPIAAHGPDARRDQRDAARGRGAGAASRLHGHGAHDESRQSTSRFLSRTSRRFQ